LSEEAAKVSQHVLNMCVRALDYCPPVDLNFGDYLRALITGDFEVVPYDNLGYRVAFVEAFRRRGIYPRDLRSLSVDALRWRPARADNSEDLLKDVLERLRAFAEQFPYLESREKMFRHTRKCRIEVHRELKNLFRSSDRRQDIMSALGLDLTTGKEHFEVHALRVSDKQGPDEAPVPPQILLTLVQERRAPGEPSGGGQPFMFSGGCTIIADQRSALVKYYVSKNIMNPARVARQQAFNARLGQPLSAVYFGSSPMTGMTERFAMLHADGKDGYYV
jgi:hypothetical protein